MKEIFLERRGGEGLILVGGGGGGGGGFIFPPPPPPPPPRQETPDSQASHLRTLSATTFSLQVQKKFSAFMLTYFFFKKTE